MIDFIYNNISNLDVADCLVILIIMIKGLMPFIMAFLKFFVIDVFYYMIFRKSVLNSFFKLLGRV